MIDLGLSEQLMYSTVRIETFLNTGGIGTGTGFFFRFKEQGDSYIPAIVTNKHVIDGGVRGRFILTEADENGNPLNTEHLPIELDNFQQRWLYHPDPQIDLCIMPIAPILHLAELQGRKPFFISLDKSLIPTIENLDELRAIENIVMIGYPNGIWDRENNLPIMRRGITATHPKFDYNGTPQLLIDAACFPGSSGSPVLIYDEGGYTDKKGNTYMGANRVILLGILFAGPQHTAQGDIRVVDIPITQREIVLSTIPNNLGYVIKSNKLLDFDELLPDQ
ncbi:trypsin-like peptidase domain-containing protein [Bacillus sp. FJAT-49732]|uniref:Trypsin-like peptidase domain-containing protein n=1 Tax=Lederbergia citrisecunda TaxID=2833583 RepID=A0A942TJ88_9BACI|nr:serine protease [Lederbergia citrisecunda]MBS4198625.1 trypsin-like peptidase domain-containing protein [Lederbergia citrisecunda]